MKKYVLIYSNDNGIETSFLDGKAITDLLQNPVEYCGIERFVEEPPSDYIEEWTTGTGLLLEVTPIVPKSIKVEYTI